VWVCVTEGFPSLPFVINEDISNEDGTVRCRRLTDLELVKLGWRSGRALKIVLEMLEFL
jgi:hypothetical protein